MRRLIMTFFMLACGFTQARADDFADQILQVHNRERAQVRAAPLVWSDSLAADAAVWAEHLADINSMQHADHAQNPHSGENLWMGSRGYYSYSAMAQRWADEKSYFRYGTFPDVSSDGNWANVGHYTQMIWRNTSEVGCAVASNADWDFLVCRYNPPGNYMGQKVY